MSILVRSPPEITFWTLSDYVIRFIITGFTRRIVGVPKAESDAILQFLFHQISDNPDFQVRFRWERDSIAIWDNRVRVTLKDALLR